MNNFDIIVIGAGPGGYVAAVSAVKAGANSVALIERDASQGGGLGGTCLHRGCIPTKTYLDNAETLNRIKEGSKRGVVTASAAIDMPAAVKFKDRVVKRLSMGVGALLKSWGVEVITGNAQVNSLDEIIVTGKDGAGQTLSCKKLILAAGSRPARVPIPGSDLPQVVTSDEILNVQTIPPRLVIVGGGVIGVEMARIFQSFGSKVTIVEMLSRLAPNLDDEVADALNKSLKSEKVAVKLGVKVESFEQGENNSVNVVVEQNGEKERIPADMVLVAVGRTPNTESFVNLNLEMNRRFVKVDSRTFQTSNPNVFAIGDVTGLSMLAHSASVMGEFAGALAAKQIYSPDEKVESGENLLAAVPSVVYGEPSASGVGMTEKQALDFCQANGKALLIGRCLFGGNGRAVASSMGEGFVKVLAAEAEENKAQILGVHIFGPMASELVNEAAVLGALKLDAQSAADVMHAHPTFGEVISIALHDALGQSCHLPKK